MAKKVGDLLGIGLLLVSIFIFTIALRETNILLLLVGLIGSVITGIVEVAFLWQKFRKWIF